MTRPAAPGMSEKAFLQIVRDLARYGGWLTYHTHNSTRSDPGFPDLCLVRGDRLLFAELKTATGRVSHTQRAWLEALRATGAEVYLWRPADMPTIAATLSRRAA